MPDTNSKNRRDDELTELLTKLYTIQEDIGAKPPTTEEEKQARAQNVAAMGQGGDKKTEKKGSRFLQLKSQIVDRLKQIHQLLKDCKEKESAGYGGDNAKEIIKMQASIREHIRQASDEWNEMDAIYKKEARKKKSKFTPEELEVQAELIKRLSVEIQKVKELQMRGYAKNRDAGAAVALNTKAIYLDSGGTLRALCMDGGMVVGWVGNGWRRESVPLRRSIQSAFAIVLRCVVSLCCFLQCTSRVTHVRFVLLSLCCTYRQGRQ